MFNKIDQSLSTFMGNYGTGTIESPTFGNDDNGIIKPIIQNMDISKQLTFKDISKCPEDKQKDIQNIITNMNETITELSDYINQIKTNQLSITDEIKNMINESNNDLTKLNKMFNNIYEH